MSYIEKVKITNYKCFKEFSFKLKEGMNIIVGNNESGKSTILEAIHLALSGLLNGKYLKNELSQYIFNKETEKNYLSSLKEGIPQPPPTISIEVFFDNNDFPEFEGDGSSDKEACGFLLKIDFDDEYKEDYEELIKTKKVATIPIEYYKITWISFARENISIKSIPIKSVLIDSASTRFPNGSDVYISKIIKDDLTVKESVELSQAYRKTKESFMEEESIKMINEKVTKNADFSTKKIEISIDLSPKNSWENALMTYFDDIPFHQIGKGEQCLIKTNLALAHEKTKGSNLILMEEPENHLSHTKLNQFIKNIEDKLKDKQIIITTHSNFIANKLGLENLILLNDKKAAAFASLEKETYEYFKKLPGYDTLRMILCKKAILVEGRSDELIIQRAFMDKNEGMLPIEKEIDVISVEGLAFERFLDIAKMIKKSVAVVTDNDKNYKKKIEDKYTKYKQYPSIEIFADERNEFHTLELQIADANKENLKLLCDVLKIDPNKQTEESIADYMKRNKTKCALNIFDAKEKILYPEYINKAIGWCK